MTVFAIWGGINNTNISQGVTNNGTNLPIGKGGTGASTAPQALKNLLPPFNADPGKVLGLDSNSDPIWVNNTSASGGMVPDYANISANKLTAPGNGTWIADATGFVQVGLDVSLTNIRIGITIRINGAAVWGDVFIEETPATTNKYGYTVIPVKQGDVVYFEISDTAQSLQGIIKFIPPIFIEQEAPVIVSPGVSYSSQEVATGETWTDGKPIYRRTFTGNIEAAADVETGTVLAYDIDTLVDSGGGIQIVNSNFHNINHTAATSTFNYFSFIIEDPLNHMIGIWSASSLNRVGTTNNAYKVWVEYTKL